MEVYEHVIIHLDMDCDALKKALLIDTDGTFLGSSPSTVFSQAEYDWGKSL